MNKKGISLIVLIITIIIMVILSTAVIISLNNNGIIGKATNAVKAANLAEVKELAQVAWAEGYLANKRGTYLNDYVLSVLRNNNIDTSNYNIVVTNRGVTVTDIGTINLAGVGYVNSTLVVEGKSTENGGEWIFDASTGTIEGIAGPYGYNYSGSAGYAIKTTTYSTVYDYMYDIKMYNYYENEKTLVIPSIIDGVAVTNVDMSINQALFTDTMYYLITEKGLENIVFSKGITDINDYGFAMSISDMNVGDAYPSSIKIILPDTLEQIGEGAFSYSIPRETYCLIDIVIPLSVEYAGRNIFEGNWRAGLEIKCEGSEDYTEANFDDRWNYDSGGPISVIYEYSE